MEDLKWQFIKLQNELSNYDLKYIYNMDETGLNPRQLPDRTYLADDEDPKDTRGDKSQNDKLRVTMVCCVSAVGEKIDILIIGKAARPYSFYAKGSKTNYDLPIPYTNQKNAWLDRTVYQHWLINVFQQEILKRHVELRNGTKRAALVMDNFDAHDSASILLGGQIDEYFLPPNVTSKKQPFDMGIGYALKNTYRYALLDAMAEYDQVGLDGLFSATALRQDPGEGRRGIKDGVAANMYDTLHLVKHSWNNISTNAIIKCWLKADILCEKQTAELKTLVTESKKELNLNHAMMEELKPIVKKIQVSKYASEMHRKAVVRLKNLFQMNDIDQLTLAFDRYVKTESKDDEIEYDMEKCVETGVTISQKKVKRKDDEIENETRSTTSQIRKMENAVTISKDAFGENNSIVKKLQQQLSAAIADRKTTQSTLDGFVFLSPKPLLPPKLQPLIKSPTFELDNTKVDNIQAMDVEINNVDVNFSNLHLA